MKQIGASWGCPNLFLGPLGEPEGTVMGGRERRRGSEGGGAKVGERRRGAGGGILIVSRDP